MPRRKNRVQDVLAMGLPDGFPADHPELSGFLNGIASDHVAKQYANLDRPPVLVIEKIEWLVTDELEEVERFQPSHDCERCREGNVTSRAYLLAHPGSHVVLGNLDYVEHWA